MMHENGRQRYLATLRDGRARHLADYSSAGCRGRPRRYDRAFATPSRAVVRGPLDGLFLLPELLGRGAVRLFYEPAPSGGAGSLAGAFRRRLLVGACGPAISVDTAATPARRNK